MGKMPEAQNFLIPPISILSLTFTYFVFQLRFLTKYIILALPEMKAGEKLESVTLKVRDFNISSGEAAEYSMGECGYNLMSAKVLIPVTSQLEKIQYDFTACITIKGYFRKTSDTKKSTSRQMRDTTFIRDYWNPTVSVGAFANQCKHIVIDCSEQLTLTECAMQIEQVCHRLDSVSKEYALDVFNDLFRKVDTRRHSQLLLSMVLFGNLFQNYFFIAKTALEQSSSTTMLKCLKHFKSTALPNSCSSYMFKLANDLCRVSFGHNYCFFNFIDTVYPFFEEKLISGKLIDSIKKKYLIAPQESDKESISCTFRVFETLCVRLNCEDAKQLLEQLLRQLPLTMAIKVYIFLKNKTPSGIVQQTDWKLIHGTLIGSVKSQLMVGKKNTKELISVAQEIGGCQDLVAVTRTDFEKAVMHCIGTADKNELEMLKSLVFNENLFLSEDQQLNLIKHLTKLKDPGLHFLLFEVLSSKIFMGAYLKADSSLFFECFDNVLLWYKHGLNDERKLRDVYCYLSRIHNIPVMKQSNSLLRYLDKIVVDFLKVIDLRKLIKMTIYIEQLSEKDVLIASMFSAHVTTLLNERYADYSEILKSLCGNRTKLRINTR